MTPQFVRDADLQMRIRRGDDLVEQKLFRPRREVEGILLSQERACTTFSYSSDHAPGDHHCLTRCLPWGRKRNSIRRIPRFLLLYDSASISEPRTVALTYPHQLAQRMGS